MSKTVSAVIGLTSLAVAVGTVAGAFRVSLHDTTGAEVAVKESTDTTVAFDAVGAGTYTVSAVRLDAAGAVLGSPVSSDPFTIATDTPATVNVDVPASVAVTLA